MREFLAGSENRLAAVAMEAVLEQTDPHFNPILLYGPPGTGKSHLAWGLASAWKRRYPRRSVICTTAMEFAQTLADAIEADSVDDLREAHRSASLLVVEDVGLLAGKAAAQQELADTIDSLVGGETRVVLTAASSPPELKGITARLRSRLGAGLTVPLALPGLQTRKALLRRLAPAHGLELPPPALDALAEGLQGTFPELRGALSQLEVSARSEGATIDAPRVRRWLAEHNGAQEPSLRTIASLTARHFSLRIGELQSPSRCRAVVTARGIAMYLARTLTRQSLDEIGRFFGGRDHATVSYGCRRTAELLEAEPSVQQAVGRLRERLRNT